MSTLKLRGSWLLVSNHLAKEIEIPINNIFQWASMVKDVYKVNIIKKILDKSSICSIMQIIIKIKEIKTSGSHTGLSASSVVKVMVEAVYHHEMAESNYIYSNSNSITKLLNKLEIKITIICIRRCKVNLLYQFHKVEMNRKQLEEFITNINLPIDIWVTNNKAK